MCDSLAQAGHNLVKTSAGHKCTKCCKRRHTRHFGYWSTLACHPRPPAECIISDRKRKHAELVKQSHEQDEEIGSETPSAGETESSQTTPSGCSPQELGRSDPREETTAKVETTLQTQIGIHNRNTGLETLGMGETEPVTNITVGCKAGKRKLEGEDHHMPEEATAHLAETTRQTQANKRSNRSNSKSCQSDISDKPEETRDLKTVEETTPSEETTTKPAVSEYLRRSSTSHEEGSKDAVSVAKNTVEATPGQTDITHRVIHNGFDDPDEDPQFSEGEPERGHPRESPDDIGYGLDMDQGHAAMEAAPAAKTGRRLRCKTHRLQTCYSDIKPRGTWQEQRKRRRANAKVRVEDKVKRRKATSNALISSVKNVEAINRSVNAGGAAQDPEYDWDFAEAIDPSHVIAKVRPDSNAIYCQRCSYFNNGGPLRRLKGQCILKIPKHRASLLKLLRQGLVPNGVEHPEDPPHGKDTTNDSTEGLSVYNGGEIPPERGKTWPKEGEILSK